MSGSGAGAGAGAGSSSGSSGHTKVPQEAYWQTRWHCPGLGTLSGHSRALERSGFWIRESQLYLDGGIALPSPSSPAPRLILVTHTHVDHANALPMLLRHSRDVDVAGETLIFSPRPVTYRLMQWVALSWAMKVPYSDPVPPGYRGPSEDTAAAIDAATLEDGVDDPAYSGRRWHPVDGVKWDSSSSDAADPWELGVTILVGKKAKTGRGTPLVVCPVELCHTVPTVGYVIGERVKKLKPELLGSDGDKKAIGERVRAAKARGEDVMVEQIQPRLAYLCDTTTEALSLPFLARVLPSIPVVMIECTYLGEDMTEEGRRRGHVTWKGDLEKSVDGSAGGQTWVLIHFSLRYSDSTIAEFFLDEGKCGLRLTKDKPDTGEPALIVLWLDTGVVELWRGV